MQGIFFIVGTGRSGTNICQKMLNIHPDIKVIGETHFIQTLVLRFGSDTVTFNDFFEIIDEHYSSNGTNKWAHNHLKASGIDPNTFYSEFKMFCAQMNQGTIREFVEAFFRFCYGEGTYFLGDKTPFYGMHMAKILKLWPDAKFIHLVRDGRYAATSMQKHGDFVRRINAGFHKEKEFDNFLQIEDQYKSMLSFYSEESVALISCIQLWKKIINQIRYESENIPHDTYLEVRYEDLVRQPISELRRIGNFLDISLPLTWLAKACQVPRPFTIWKQRKRISGAEYDSLTKEAASMLKVFNYETVHHHPKQIIQVRSDVKELFNWVIFHGILAKAIAIANLLREQNKANQRCT